MRDICTASLECSTMASVLSSGAQVDSGRTDEGCFKRCCKDVRELISVVVLHRQTNSRMDSVNAGTKDKRALQILVGGFSLVVDIDKDIGVNVMRFVRCR